MESTPGRVLEGVPGRQDNVGGDVRGQAAEVDGLRKASVAVAVVSAAVLVGGGAGMLAGGALGAINPFALGMVGAAVGACAPGLLAMRPWRRGVRRVLGG